MKLTEAHKEFVKDLENKGRAEATIIAYNKDIFQLLEYLKKQDIVETEQVTTDSLTGFMSMLANNDYTPKSISRKTNSTKTFFKFLHEDRKAISTNPATLVSHPKINAKAPRILSKIEYKALRDAVKQDLRTFAIVEILLQTGCRISELSDIKLSEIDMENKDKAVLKIPEKGNTPEREIPLNNSVQKAIEDYLKIRPRSTKDFLFVTKTGNQLLVRNIRATLDKYFKDIGLNDVKVNDLRHTFIAQHLERGAPLFVVSKIAGHKRISTTEKYLNYIKPVEKTIKAFSNRWKKNKKWQIDAKVLKQALDEYEKISAEHGSYGDYGYYFSLRSSQELDNKKLKAQQNKLTDFSTKLFNEIQFFELELSKIPVKIQKTFLKAEELKDYNYFLGRVFKMAPFTLSEPEERILNLKSPVSHGNWTKMLETLLSKEERDLKVSGKYVTKNISEILSLISDSDKKTRDNAVLALNDIFNQYIDVAEHEFNSVLQNKKINDELRGYKTPDQASLLGDDVEKSTVDAMRDAVVSFYDISKEYYKLKAKMLGQKKLGYHERNVEYGEVTKKYSYEEAISTVSRVFKSLDTEFGDIFDGFVKNGQIDAFPKKGKRGGAFCAHALLSQPTYILLNYTKQLNDVCTIAHEAGHGIHNELQKPYVNGLDFGCSLATAEVASTFMEDFVLEEILKKADDNLRLVVLMQKLNDDVSTMMRQVAFYNFEWDVHTEFRKQGYLGKDVIGELFSKHMKAYMGTAVDHPDWSKNWWIYVQHFRYFFYVYSYASGQIISKSLQRLVREDKSNIEKVKKFLQAGESNSPANIFKSIGIDINNKKFWEKGLLEVKDTLKETTALAKKLGKI